MNDCQRLGEGTVSRGSLMGPRLPFGSIKVLWNPRAGAVVPRCECVKYRKILHSHDG